MIMIIIIIQLTISNNNSNIIIVITMMINIILLSNATPNHAVMTEQLGMRAKGRGKKCCRAEV